MDDIAIRTVIRFTAATGRSIDATLDEDNPAARDLVAMLPLTLACEDFNGVEKIAHPPRAHRASSRDPLRVVPRIAALR